MILIKLMEFLEFINFLLFLKYVWIQGVFMGKVDCIVEMRREQFEAGFSEGLLEAARNFLMDGDSLERVSKNTTLPMSVVEKLAREVKSSE